MNVQHAKKGSEEPTEATALLGDVTPSSEKQQPWLQPVHLVQLCGFLVSLAFSITQVPIVYVFRLMTCDAYYETHPDPPASDRDRCAIPAIEAGTARAVALIGASTTIFGFINLFITAWTIKRIGVKLALALQVSTPAIRLVIQSVGVLTGRYTGIVIMQASQVVTVMGGPSGYMLALNTYITEVTEHRERTGSLGRLQGGMMLGMAAGALMGGIVADLFGIITPFEVALGMFVLSTVYVLTCLPWFPSKPTAQSNKPDKDVMRMLGPLRTIMPSQWMRPGGSVHTEYGAIFLVAGAFLAVLATGYLPTLLQMYATDIFGFGPRRNSYVVASHSFLRGVFLMFGFPRIIKLGRRITEAQSLTSPVPSLSTTTSGTATPSERAQLANAMQDEAQEDVMPPKPTDEQETFDFDLIYTRGSLLVDGILTMGAAFIQEGWQMYLVAVLLPFGAGTASAAKGVILQMCSPEDRTDALSAIAFVEMLARLSTTFVFGLIFAAFANIGKTYLVFVCNAAVALVGFCVLLLSRFPPKGSKRISAHTESASREGDT